MQPQPVACRALPDFRVWIKFADGAEGIVDLSHLAGQGVFAAWNEPGFFGKVFIDPEAGTITWPGELDLDPYVLYSNITGKALPGSAGSEAAA